MKNVLRISIVILLVGINSLSIFAQQKVAEKMFNDFRGRDEVTYLSLSKNLLNFVDFDVESDEDGEEHKVTGDLHEVKVVLFKPEVAPDVEFVDQVRKYMKKGKYSLVEDDDNDEDSEVWVHRKGRKVYECHVIFQGEKNGVLLSFFGDFKIDDVDKLKDKMEDYK
ncbi:DUF4252 domain-containing protein [Labilibacter marinus]|uniref:DUF4252 domain-containing protein n=1 Tax=Labilibacter marinus TaxID=1477105 RepID=UPI001300F41D|nr:DUF4252 domain-containing protein [Labilibacter marinus]